MFRNNENKFARVPVFKAEYAVTIDQFDAKDFNINEAGYIRNDISQLARAQSKSEYDAIMSRLVQLKNQGGLPDGTSNEDAIAMIKPRWAQSPNEIEQFIQMTNGNVMEKVNAAYEKALKDTKVSESKEIETPVVSES